MSESAPQSLLNEAVIQGTFPQMARPTAYINFIAEIVPKTVEAFMGLASDLTNRGHSALHVMMSSPGGNVAEGIALYNFLRSLPVDLTTHNTGSMNSIANIVFLAGNKRNACPHTTFMFHGVSMQTQAPQSFERKALRERLASIESDEKRIGEIVAERTKLDKSIIDTFFLEARTLIASEAMSAGIVHEVSYVSVPKGSPIYTLTPQR